MQPKRIHVLLVENSPGFGGLLRDELSEAVEVQFDLHRADSTDAALRHLAEAEPDVVLLDLAACGTGGLECLERVRSVSAGVPIIALCPAGDRQLGLRAMEKGAQDYLLEDQIHPDVLVRSIRYAMECKRADLAVLQAEDKYRGIFEHIVEGIFQTTPDGRYVSANSALARIYGYDSPEDLMTRLTDIAHQLYVDPGRREEFVRLMEENDVVTGFESQIRRKDGRIIWISENVRAIRDEHQRLLNYEGTVEDITERKRSEEELRNSETLYHSLVENLPQNIFRKDLNERFTFANQRFCQTLGKPLWEILGRTDFDFFPPELAAKYQQDDRKILESGEAFETIEEHVPPSGEKLYVNVSKTPLYDSKGNIIGLQGIFWDITQRLRAEKELRRTTVELEKNRRELHIKNEQMQEDLRMAREIQQAIIPQQYPSFPKSADPADSLLRFCHRYLPTGAIGGDFFNVRALSDTKAGVFICDVMGHGVRSALVTAIMRALVEELANLTHEPGQLLGQINNDLRAILRQSGTPMFTTAFCLLIDLEEGQICYANAGHPKPLLIHRESGRIEILANSSGKCCPALGLFEGAFYPTSRRALNTGDLVMLFTDGLYDIEGPHQDHVDQDWLLAEVRKRARSSASELFDGLLSEIQVLSGGASFADDVCMVGIEVTLPQPTQR